MWKDTEALRSRWGFIYLHIYLFTCLFISGDPFSEGLIKTVGGKKKFCQGILSMFLRFFHPWKQINSGGKQIVLNRVNFYIFLKYFSGEFPFFLDFFYFFILSCVNPSGKKNSVDFFSGQRMCFFFSGRLKRLFFVILILHNRLKFTTSSRQKVLCVFFQNHRERHRQQFGSPEKFYDCLRANREMVNMMQMCNRS